MAKSQSSQPLTAEEQSQLDDLQARKAAADAAAARAVAADRVTALAPIKAFVEVIGTADIKDKLQAAIDSRPEPAIYQQLLQLQQIIDYNVKQLDDAVTAADMAANPPASPNG